MTRRARFPPPDPAGFGSPASSVLSRRSDSRRPFRLLAFVRSAVPRTAVRRQAAGSCCYRLLFGTAPVPQSSPFGSHSWRHAGSPRFLGNPFAHMPCSSTPADRMRQAVRDTPDIAFRSVDGVGSAFSHVSRLNDTACALAVYASRFGLLQYRARLAPRWWPTLTGQDSHLPGCIRRFPLCVFNSHRSPLLEAFPGAPTGVTP